ncbi:MAG TPA: preprotein translocase subunit SecE [Conexibacter sp.]|nr:preprotein translocase subunit SecE [Conexibacter sp.]
MARDRRRAKQRRDRQARAAGGASPRADAEGGAARAPEHNELDELHEREAPELASGEVDLADAQLALGRPELIDTTAAGGDGPDVVDDPNDLPELDDERDFEALEDRVDEAEEAYEEGASFDEEEAIANGGNGRVEDGAEVVRSRRRAPARASEPREGNRVMTFLRGSWRELQRVQWPDRRQVGQATAVVIGFVIVAGAFLGLADYVAGKIVDFII